MEGGLEVTKRSNCGREDTGAINASASKSHAMSPSVPVAGGDSFRREK